MNITYQKYRVGDTAVFDQIIPAYRQVFADPPWDEWMRCSVCNQQWGRDDWNQRLTDNHPAETCACGGPIVEFWPESQVRSDLAHELTPEASCWLAYDGPKVIGFCWGYPISLEDLETKLQTQISLRFLWKCGFNPGTIVAYQDELGVVASYRRHGIGRQLVTLRQLDFSRLRLGLNIVRTRKTPPSVTYLWYTRERYREIGRYDDGRVVMAKSQDGPLIPEE